MAQQPKNRFAKRNQHCDATKRNHKFQNNQILLKQLLNNGISLDSKTVTVAKQARLARKREFRVRRLLAPSSMMHILL